MDFTTRKAKGFIPAYLFALLIWIVASLPGDDLGRIQKYPDNLWFRFFLSDPFMHFMVFGLLTLFICRGYDQESRGSIPMARVGFLAAGYGLFIEVCQGILPWRSFGLDDLFWNTVGVLFFLFVTEVVLRLRWKQSFVRTQIHADKRR